MQQLNMNMIQSADTAPPTRIDRGSEPRTSEQAFRKAIQKASSQERQTRDAARQADGRGKTDAGEKMAGGKTAERSAASEQTGRTQNAIDVSAENPEAALADAQIEMMVALLTNANARVVAFAPMENPILPQTAQGAAQANLGGEPVAPVAHAAIGAASGESVGQTAQGGQLPGQSAEGQNQGQGQGQSQNAQAQGQPQTAQPQQAQSQTAQAQQQTAQAQQGAAAQTTGSQAAQAQTAQGVADEAVAQTAKQAESKEAKPEQPNFLKPDAALAPDKVHVKVGDGGSLKSESFAQNVADKIMEKAAEGRQQFEIHLMPKDLGKIIIKLMIQGGRAEIIMQCANPKTQQLVLANAETIRNIVETGTGMQASLTAAEEEETLAYNAFDEKEEDGGQDGQEDERLEQADADGETFLHQLRLGLIDEEAFVA